jgi:hypothetical protein
MYYDYYENHEDDDDMDIPWEDFPDWEWDDEDDDWEDEWNDLVTPDRKLIKKKRLAQ